MLGTFPFDVMDAASCLCSDRLRWHLRPGMALPRLGTDRPIERMQDRTKILCVLRSLKNR
jgi:hypothetical protein